MKVSIIQPDIIWEDKTRNLSHLDELILPLYEKTDIVILPEMFSSGFSMNTEKLSEPADGHTFQWMKETAERGNFGLCGSYIVFEDNHFYNRFVFVSPGNESWHYDKRHLFSMAGENKFFTQGKSRLVFRFRGATISPYICYDLRFPVWSRNRNEYDLAVYVASWPQVRISVWDTLIKARAIENQCYVAGANRVGADGTGTRYSGGSYIVNPRGEILKSAGSQECTITSEISMSDLTEFREKFPVREDSDDFQIL